VRSEPASVGGRIGPQSTIMTRKGKPLLPFTCSELLGCVKDQTGVTCSGFGREKKLRMNAPRPREAA